jgi:hypothetical protein
MDAWHAIARRARYFCLWGGTRTSTTTSPRGTTWWERWLEAGSGETCCCRPYLRAAVSPSGGGTVGLCVRTANRHGGSIALAPKPGPAHLQRRPQSSASVAGSPSPPGGSAPHRRPLLDAPGALPGVVEALNGGDRSAMASCAVSFRGAHRLAGARGARSTRATLQGRAPQPWYEISAATPTWRCVDIGDLSSVLLCAFPQPG